MFPCLVLLGRLHLIKSNSLPLLLLHTLCIIQMSALVISAKVHQDLDKSCCSPPPPFFSFFLLSPQRRQGAKVPTEQNKIKRRSAFSVSEACAIVYNACSLLQKGNERMNLYY